MPSYPCRTSCLGKSWGSKASREDMRWGSRGTCHYVPLGRPPFSVHGPWAGVPKDGSGEEPSHTFPRQEPPEPPPAGKAPSATLR